MNTMTHSIKLTLHERAILQMVNVWLGGWKYASVETVREEVLKHAPNGMFCGESVRNDAIVSAYFLVNR